MTDSRPPPAAPSASGAVPVRERTVRWEDPYLALQQAGGRSGLELLQAMRDGALPHPPIAMLLDFTLVVAEHGRTTFACTPGEHHHNPIGSVHGGLAATLLDSAMGCAVQTTLEAGTGYTTLDLSVRYVRPLQAGDGTVECTGHVVSRGQRVATAEGRVLDARGRLCATGTTSCLLFPLA